MTDIAHYCRNHGGPCGAEAADEIERLRRELSAALSQLKPAPKWDGESL